MLSETNILSNHADHLHSLSLSVGNVYSPQRETEGKIVVSRICAALAEPLPGDGLQGSPTAPIVIDTGASVSVTPFKTDFVGPIQVLPSSSVRGLVGSTKIHGIGPVKWTLRDMNGIVAAIETPAYYIPDADIRLFSPQVYLQSNESGSLLLTAKTVTLTLSDSTKLAFPYNDSNNLPLMLEDRAFKPRICFVGVSVGELATAAMSEFAQFLSVADESNQNITGPQKELLAWHWRLGHIGFTWLQWLMRAREGRAPVIATKHRLTATCPPPLCAACQIARMTRKGAGTSVEKKLHEHDLSLRADHLVPGQMVSLDQFESTTLGCRQHTLGREAAQDRYHGGTIAVDHASSMIWVYPQVSLCTGETH